MKYLGMDLAVLIEKGAVHTAQEIVQQPELWQKVWRGVSDHHPDLLKFLNTTLPNIEKIILTGAGTSAFIGLSLSGIFQRSTGIATEAIATTDLVSHPKDYFNADLPVLIISFARSGNSPESVAAVALADELCKTCYHLIITCNVEGKLARYTSNKNKFVLALPKEANDLSLAMTSSYSSMLLAGILITQLDALNAAKKSIDIITEYARKVINYYSEDLCQIAEKDFDRVVFLGSGPLFGTATESHLKLLELTDGRIAGKEDSFLGFRHGPKAFITETTLVFYIFSNEEYVLKYEKDLVNSVKKGHPPMLEIGISESALTNVDLDHFFYFSETDQKVSGEYLAVCSVLPAQILGFFKSLQLGLKPDMPSTTGAITRVVEGVQIYGLNE